MIAPERDLYLEHRNFRITTMSSNSTAPYTGFAYANQGTIVRPKIITAYTTTVSRPGDVRSLPQDIGPTAPNKRIQTPKTREMPVDIQISGTRGLPAMEPENAPTLQPECPL